jgi:rRNA maturation endonuclease Nob1
MEEQKKITVTCERCETVYSFETDRKMESSVCPVCGAPKRIE